ncbi:glycosyltransferase [Streptomyces sp. 8ZJF_21]|uniref:glycosyltransferase n=1 Tax=Streptomyces sp. 8ZJF_21 TaxID=2903141 RepID=UPI001E2B044A|nr:glycosyltransferase [Streptomyces sp. 8ZJF_21]MCD9592757.1 glycosyltransferase [Streptomyces sp. 8ZJF_21]
MRILIVTAGSRGDVAPFTGLGRRLLDAGHEVAVAAHAPFSGLVRGCGLDHRPLPGDPRELIRARGRAASPGEARAVTAAFLDRLADGVVGAVADGTDLVLTAFGPAGLSRAAGEACAVSVIGTYLAPSFATREFPLPGASGAAGASGASGVAGGPGAPGVHGAPGGPGGPGGPGAPGDGGLGPEGNLAAGRELLARAGGLQAEVLTRLRARLGLPATASPEPDVEIRPVLHGFSPLVVPRPADWPSQVDVVGYWWPARPRDWQPPAELTDFLQAGPPPVFIGFGSMAPGQGERLGELVTAAVARAGVRAVVQAGWAGLTASGDDILTVGDLPHDWLFPRTAAVVHHAGAGTTAAGLRAGVPAVAVPAMADQPFWAARLHRLGVAPRPLPLDALTAESLGAAITACLTDPALGRRAADLAEAVAAEDGAAAVLAHIGAVGRGEAGHGDRTSGEPGAS